MCELSDSAKASPWSSILTAGMMANAGDRIFSGDYSREMWEAINGAKTKKDLRWALYLVCCRLQELESKLSPASRAGGNVEPVPPHGDSVAISAGGGTR
jgi:hypothetical protein